MTYYYYGNQIYTTWDTTGTTDTAGSIWYYQPVYYTRNQYSSYTYYLTPKDFKKGELVFIHHGGNKTLGRVVKVLTGVLKVKIICKRFLRQYSSIRFLVGMQFQKFAWGSITEDDILSVFLSNRFDIEKLTKEKRKEEKSDA